MEGQTGSDKSPTATAPEPKGPSKSAAPAAAPKPPAKPQTPAPKPAAPDPAAERQEADAFDDKVLDELLGEDKPKGPDKPKPPAKPAAPKPTAKPKAEEAEEKGEEQAEDESEPFDVDSGPAVFHGKTKRERITAARRALLRDGTWSEEEIDALQDADQAKLLDKGAKALKRQNDADVAFRKLKAGKKPADTDHTERAAEDELEDEDDPFDPEEDDTEDLEDESEDDADDAPARRSGQDDDRRGGRQTGWMTAADKFLKKADLQLTNEDRRAVLNGLRGPVGQAISAAVAAEKAQTSKVAKAHQELQKTTQTLARSLINTRVSTVLRELVSEWPALRDRDTAKQVVRLMAEDDPGSLKALGPYKAFMQLARSSCWAVLGKAAQKQERERLLADNAETVRGQTDTDSEPHDAARLTDDQWETEAARIIAENAHNPGAAAAQLSRLSRR